MTFLNSRGEEYSVIVFFYGLIQSGNALKAFEFKNLIEYLEELGALKVRIGGN